MPDDDLLISFYQKCEKHVEFCLEKQIEILSIDRRIFVCYLFIYVQTNIHQCPSSIPFFCLMLRSFHTKTTVVNQFIGWNIRLRFFTSSLTLRAYSKILEQQKCRMEKQKQQQQPENERERDRGLGRKEERRLNTLFRCCCFFFQCWYLFIILFIQATSFFTLDAINVVVFFSLLFYLVCVCGFKSNVRKKYLPFWVYDWLFASIPYRCAFVT